MKKFDIVCLGELLADFTPYGVSPAGWDLYERNAGGAPANVAAALSALGLRAAFIGKVGRDAHGLFLCGALEKAGVDTSGLKTDPKAYTTMAFVSLDGDGERDFSFSRGADACLRADEIDMSLIADARAFHFGALSMTGEPALSATLAAARRAREAGCVVSYDPNYRATLWPDGRAAAERMRAALPLADIVKVSEEEARLLAGADDLETAGQALLREGPSCVIVTRGADGAVVCLPSGSVPTPARRTKAADTTGAGDAFLAGFLYSCLSRDLHPRELSADQVRGICEFAHAAGALCVSRRGGIPAMPSLAEVMDSLRPRDGGGEI